jgi:hypothetical protein
MGMKFAEAKDKALLAGASEADIIRNAKGSFGGPVFKRNMIVALQLHSWCNSPEEWARLAGALAPKGYAA